MRQDSFSAMLSIINDDGLGDIPNVFHAMDREEKLAFIGDIGERSEGQDLVRIRGNVGILDIDGPIVHRASGVSKVSGLTSIEGLGREFQELEANSDIDLMDTPGGVVAGTSEFADMVAKCTKRTVAYIYGAAASAGYWIASAADKIISSDVGAVGSIGVVMTAYIYESENRVEVVSSQSPNKRLSLKSKEGKKNAQEVVDDMADIFIGAVAKYRKTTSDDILKNYGQGKIFVAKQALERGMIDGISTLSDLLGKYDKESRTEPVMIHGATIESFTIKGKEYRVAPDTEIQTKIRETDQSNTGDATPKTRKDPERKEGKKMTLKELMAEHPGIREEVKAITDNAVSQYQAMVTEASKFISESYEGPVSKLAVEVIQGKAPIDSLKAVVVAVDQMREDKKSQAAKGESGEAGDIGGLNAAEQTSDDGMIRNASDIEAEAKRLKAVAVLA
jgi:ClpP class serine protease